MKARTLAVLLFAALASQAAMGQQVTLASIATESNLTVREVQMVLSRGPSSYHEYRSSYVRAKNQLARSVGTQRMAELAALYQAGKLPLGTS
ncbi:MAG TPA: hypothetical protein VFL14_00085 [Xanthomonadales bacterium]|nr:hypothetical protein [Xanthomonadales bacterium]